MVVWKIENFLNSTPPSPKRHFVEQETRNLVVSFRLFSDFEKRMIAVFKNSIKFFCLYMK